MTESDRDGCTSDRRSFAKLRKSGPQIRDLPYSPIHQYRRTSHPHRSITQSGSGEGSSVADGPGAGRGRGVPCSVFERAPSRGYRAARHANSPIPQGDPFRAGGGENPPFEPDTPSDRPRGGRPTGREGNQTHELVPAPIHLGPRNDRAESNSRPVPGHHVTSGDHSAGECCHSRDERSRKSSVRVQDTAGMDSRSRARRRKFHGQHGGRRP